MPFLLDQKAVNFRDRPLLFIDLEMTGLDVPIHEIVEVAALLVNQSDFSIQNSYYTKVIPQHIETASPRSLKVINYSPSAWQDAIPLRQTLQELSQFAPNAILVGWSVQNEWDFLVTALEREDLPIFFDYHLLEVWTLAYHKLRHHPDITKLDITATCRVLDIPVERHKPDSDIRATYEIFRKLIDN
jgi:oligoribonuclease (3'-5' exoribonuclease)